MDPPSFPCRPGSSILIDCRHLGGSLTENQDHHETGKEFIKRGRCTYFFCTIACTNSWLMRSCSPVTIDMLPDVALLDIFDFHLFDPDDEYHWYWRDTGLTAWHPLVHVCRKWRNTVFGSPLRLNLRLYCEPRRMRERMAVWPSLPIVVSDDCDKIRDKQKWVDNIVAVFEHSESAIAYLD